MTAPALVRSLSCRWPQELRGSEVLKSSIFLTAASALNFLRGPRPNMCHETTINSVFKVSQSGHGPCEHAAPADGRFVRTHREALNRRGRSLGGARIGRTARGRGGTLVSLEETT